MGDRVVQLARQLLALAEPDLVGLAQPRAGSVANRGPERGGKRQQQRSGRSLAEVPADRRHERVRGHGERHPGHRRHAAAPPEQGVRNQQDVRRGVELHRRAGAQQRRRVAEHDRAEHHRGHEDRARAPPRQADRRSHARDQRDARPHHVVAQGRLEQPGRHQRRDQHPVPPERRRRVRGRRLSKERPEGAAHHGVTVEGRRGSRHRPEVRTRLGRKEDATVTTCPMVFAAVSGHDPSQVARLAASEPNNEVRQGLTTQPPTNQPRGHT